jgi:nicotinate (nicotinamide) nucleotide adenylyltransferase
MPIKKVAIFGGTFDPVTRGHIEIASMIGDLQAFYQIIFVPSGRRPDKAQVATPDQILYMLKIARSALPEEIQAIVEIDDRDIKGDNTPTADLMRSLYRKFPPNEFKLYFVVGGDLVEPLDRLNGESQITGLWYRGKVLWEENNFVIVPRLGYPDPNTFGLDPDKCIILPKAPFATSSTEVRLSRKQKKEWMHFVGEPALIQYIEYNNIYE